MENLTREGLKALGVTDEAIDEILKTRGNEINKAEATRKLFDNKQKPSESAAVSIFIMRNLRS